MVGRREIRKTAVALLLGSMGVQQCRSEDRGGSSNPGEQVISQACAKSGKHQYVIVERVALLCDRRRWEDDESEDNGYTEYEYEYTTNSNNDDDGEENVVGNFYYTNSPTCYRYDRAKTTIECTYRSFTLTVWPVCFVSQTPALLSFHCFSCFRT